MTADFTPEQAATLQRFDLAPDAPESIREQLAEALYDVTEAAEYAEWPDVTPKTRVYVLTLADAALRVLRGPDTTTALARVEALADQWESDAARADAAEPLNTDGLIRMILAAKHCREHARELRAALDPSVTFSTWATVKRLRAELDGSR